MRKFLLACVPLALTACDQSGSNSQLLNSDNSIASNESTTSPVSNTVDSVPQSVGRFIIVHSPQVERDTILLDTATGKTWSAIEDTSYVGAPAAWEMMPKAESADEMAIFDSEHVRKKSSAARNGSTETPASKEGESPPP